MLPPYEETDAPRDRSRSHRAPLPALSDMRYRTTYRCIRMGCAMTVRLLNPIEHCPRCAARMAVIEGPKLDFEEFVAAAAAEVVAGFDALLRAA